jgi:rhamnose transport system ATP-binding protein
MSPEAPRERTVLLRVRGLEKAYGGVHALRGVSLEVREGEVHALVGENGAGKSTLIAIVSGAREPDAGTVEIDGRDAGDLDPVSARALGVAVIHQRPALFPELSVAENVALGAESGGGLRRVDWKGRRARAKALLEGLGCRVDPEDRAGDLGAAEQQLVEIARALGARARIVVLDEPTAALSEEEARRVLDVVRELRREGCAVVYVSHRLEEVLGIADRVTVLRDGSAVATLPAEKTTREELVRLMVGRGIERAPGERGATRGEVLLDVRGLSSAALGLSDVSISVRAGEIVGLFGLVGAGRTELARCLFGLERRDSGVVSLRGRPLDLRSPEAAIRAGLAYVPEDRPRHGVVLDLDVGANIVLAAQDRLARRGFLDRAREDELAGALVERLRVKTDSLRRSVRELSGGNQQKVALARWLALDPAVLLLDEPTQGIDVGARAEIHALVRELAGRGKGVLAISSDLEEVLEISDRIAVMREGTVVAIRERRDLTREELLALALGHATSGAGTPGA